MANSKIEWTDKVWNPCTGCTKVSAGCRECYAKILHDMRHKAYLEGKKLPEQYSSPFEEVRCHDNRLEIPLHWKKPQRIFVNSMSDLFHPSVPFEFIDSVYEVMGYSTQHTFQILTKRPERALEYYNWTNIFKAWSRWEHIWLGVSVESQKTADERIPLLLQTPAAVRFISVEPMLGEIDLNFNSTPASIRWIKGLDWVICGGESGANARPMNPDWVRSLRDQCKETNVPFFFKQWGKWFPVSEEYVTSKLTKFGVPKNIRQTEASNNFQCYESRGKKNAGRILDGVEYKEVPKTMEK